MGSIGDVVFSGGAGGERRGENDGFTSGCARRSVSDFNSGIGRGIGGRGGRGGRADAIFYESSIFASADRLRQ